MEATVYKCPGCGADIKYNPTLQLFSCDYCLNTYTVEEMDAFASGNSAKKKKEQNETKEFETMEADEYRCSQCGAVVVTDEHTVATFCLYCQNPSIIKQHVSDMYLPDLVIPFKIDRESAITNYKKWSNKFFVPKDFKTLEQQEKMRGLYIPYWLFDITGDFDFSGTAKRIKTWRSGDYRYTKTDTYQIDRSGIMNFLKVPTDASSKMDNETMNIIEPYNYTELEPFNAAFLSGFYAEKYDETQEVTYPRIESEIKRNITSEIGRSTGQYTNTQFIKRDLSLNQTKIHYSFFPVWILTYKYNDKIYQFTMNAQTGKLHGKLPIDKSKVMLFLGLVTLIIFIVVFIGSMVGL